MKLLGWMHRKFRQDSGDVFKDFAGGGTCNYLYGRPSLEADEEHRRGRPFQGRSLLVRPGELVAGGDVGGGGDMEIEELLGGLLTIGTLGIAADPVEEENAAAADEEAVDEEQKPVEATAEEEVVIPAAMDAIAEKEAEATTETDLMAMSAELEKVLAAEAERCRPSAAGERVSSARPSHVSAGGSAACPLQGFLFGLPVELAETMPAAVAAGRNQRRASLGELFMKSRIAEEESSGYRGWSAAEGAAKTVAAGGAEEKTAAANGVHVMMKRMLKRRKSKGSDGGPTDGSTVETKFQKILQIFHRKIHPESSIMTEKHSKHHKNKNKDYATLTEADDGGGPGSQRLITFTDACRRESIPSFSCCSYPPSFTFSGSDSNGNREHWIKTDADYLVLEL